jgi:protein-S-isoprenylcysteine O-methyltransferase Ste14
MDSPLPPSTPAPAHAPTSSVAARWMGLIADHVVPGTLCLLVGIANWQTAYAAFHGVGPVETLDVGARAWLILNKLVQGGFFLLVAYLFTVRAPRRGPRAGALPAIIALAGTFALMFIGLPTHMGLLPPMDPSPHLTIPGTIITIIGTLFAIYALAALGRFFGVFPEARGLMTRGPYAHVRHPVYLAEIIVSVGMILPILSGWTVALFIVFVALQYARAVLEERALTAAIPEYAEYARRTWRIIPGIH